MGLAKRGCLGQMGPRFFQKNNGFPICSLGKEGDNLFSSWDHCKKVLHAMAPMEHMIALNKWAQVP